MVTIGCQKTTLRKEGYQTCYIKSRKIITDWEAVIENIIRINFKIFGIYGILNDNSMNKMNHFFEKVRQVYETILEDLNSTRKTISGKR